MPGQDGVEFAKKIRHIHNYQISPIVFITGAGNNWELEAYKKLHCYDYILKPFSVKTLEGKLNRHLHFILASIETNVPEKAVNLISKYIEDIAAINSKKELLTFDMTCNDDLNALLYDQRKKWEEYNVTIICTSDNQFNFPLQRYEFIEVIGNLIQNRCEYVSALSLEKHIVWIKIGNVENKQYIAVKIASS